MFRISRAAVPTVTSRGSPGNCSYLQSGHASRSRRVSSTVFPSQHGFPADTRMFGFRSGSTCDVKTTGNREQVVVVCVPHAGKSRRDRLPLGGEFILFGCFRRSSLQHCTQLFVNTFGTNIVSEKQVCTRGRQT